MSINNGWYDDQRNLPLEEKVEICSACGGLNSVMTFEECCTNCPVRNGGINDESTARFDIKV